MHGFSGRVLHIDLTSGRSAHHQLEASRLRRYMGGIGLGTSLLLEYAPPDVDPLSPDNPLIFATAPLVGTGLTTTAKFAVVTKSPLTGFIADSLSSSHFALELKRLGIDALVITGQAPSLVYLLIRGERVEIRAADQLRGKTPAETQSFVRSDATDNGYARPIEGLIVHFDMGANAVIEVIDHGITALPPNRASYYAEHQPSLRG